MSDPGIETFEIAAFSATDNGAAAVYGNDVALAAAFGSLDIADNIANDKSPIIIGPWRGLVDGAATLFTWTVPSSTHNWELELWELHVSPLPGMDGGYSGAGYDLTSSQIYVKNDADYVGTFGVDFASPAAGSASYSLRLDNLSDNVVAEGGEGSLVSFPPSPVKYLATISVLGYMRHRVK